MSKRKINPRDYDFLWLVNNISFFDTSVFVEKGYSKYDFLFTGQGKEWKTYLGKKDREKLSRFGLIFLQKRLPDFKKKVINKTREAAKKIKKIRQKNLSEMSNPELRKDFLETVRFTQSLWEPYFFTEYFFHDKAQEKIEENPQGNQFLLKKAQEMQKLKFKLRTFINQTIFKGNIFEKYFKEIEKRTNRKNLFFLHYKEIGYLLKGKKTSKVERKNYVWGKFNNWKPITGIQALKIINSFDKTALQEVQQKKFIGQVANPGLYRGRVKIIPFDVKKDLTKEITKMEKGNVLVTGSTGPEMMLACKKAGAIVTEEGGICSHAAIVSRELKIPCIIGTKIATKVLKDGDLIEVDANQGVVKILKKRK